MNDKRTVLILLASALVLIVGAYFLFTGSEEPESQPDQVTGEVTPPSKAPDWVAKGQDVSPDYSPAQAQPGEEKVQGPAAEEKGDKGQEEPKTIEISEDKMVSFTFAESLADFLLQHFQPKSDKGKPATTASAVALNKYFGRDLDGFNVNADDIRSARQTVLGYAFTPDMLHTLYELYAPAFMAHLEDTALNDEREYTVGPDKVRRTLTKPELQAMLRLDARRLDSTAELFQAIGDDPAIVETVGKYRRAAKAVERANAQLQTIMSEEGDASEASDRLKQAIMQREQARTETIKHIHKSCRNCDEMEAFYLAQWAYRRSLETDQHQKSFEAASQILFDLAAKFRSKADTLG